MTIFLEYNEIETLVARSEMLNFNLISEEFGIIEQNTNKGYIVNWFTTDVDADTTMITMRPERGGVYQELKPKCS